MNTRLIIGILLISWPLVMLLAVTASINLAVAIGIAVAIVAIASIAAGLSIMMDN